MRCCCTSLWLSEGRYGLEVDVAGNEMRYWMVLIGNQWFRTTKLQQLAREVPESRVATHALDSVKV